MLVSPTCEDPACWSHSLVSGGPVWEYGGPGKSWLCQASTFCLHRRASTDLRTAPRSSIKASAVEKWVWKQHHITYRYCVISVQETDKAMRWGRLLFSTFIIYFTIQTNFCRFCLVTDQSHLFIQSGVGFTLSIRSTDLWRIFSAVGSKSRTKQCW